MVGPTTFAPLGAVSKTQTAVSRSTTESEVIALDYAIRSEGLPALSFWDNVLPIFGSSDAPEGGNRRKGGPRGLGKGATQVASNQANPCAKGSGEAQTTPKQTPMCGEDPKGTGTRVQLIACGDNEVVTKS